MMKITRRYHESADHGHLPMKAHSARVPNKNLRTFNDRPLYHWIMESLICSRHVKQVVINTDSPAIAEDAATHFGEFVRIHDRPQEIRGDFVSMNHVINDDLEKVEGEHFLQTHSTNPLLRTQTIDHAVERYFELLDRGYDSLFTVNRIQKRLYDEQGRAVNHDPHTLLRTQDLPPLFEENSCLYLFSRKSFASANQRIGNRPFLFEIPPQESIDIDEEIDFRIAEFLYRSSNNS